MPRFLCQQCKQQVEDVAIWRNDDEQTVSLEATCHGAKHERKFPVDQDLNLTIGPILFFDPSDKE